MTATDRFHESDPTGFITLERFAAATRFNRWMFNTIRPYCKGHVLEVGSGIGNISELFLEHGFSLTASDLRDTYCEYLRKRLGQLPGLKDVISVDLEAPYITTQCPQLLGQFDTVVALNVIEHIENDGLALANCWQLLKPGGNLVMLVPAYQALYNKFDEELGHFRRYSARTQRLLLRQSGYEVAHQQYFNLAGIFGWMVNGQLLKKRLIPRKQLMLFDKLMPVIRLADILSFRAFGLSTIAIGRKPL
ncbi:class I SAM-dependent methyltransferase [Paraflavitalea pollutisoli]|uniref:class I SAM-dependent methyltransferase n=1 Tax=Paraflavitalea pollutisoli TaxID=3034143 RepID=UPI0023EB6BDC|nr:methyltransferase domain-containing protein [Paraflavitalea sp. H1-2-19X]